MQANGLPTSKTGCLKSSPTACYSAWYAHFLIHYYTPRRCVEIKLTVQAIIFGSITVTVRLPEREKDSEAGQETQTHMQIDESLKFQF